VWGERKLDSLGLGEGCFSLKSGSVQWNSHITTQPQTLPFPPYTSAELLRGILVHP